MAGPEERAEPCEGVGADLLGRADEIGAGAVQAPGADATAGSRERDGLFGAQGTSADRTGRVGRGGQVGEAGGSGLHSLVCPVDGQPVAVLAGLALAGRERREACGTRGDAVAVAVGEDLRANLLFGMRRAGHVPECARGSIILSTYNDNHDNIH